MCCAVHKVMMCLGLVQIIFHIVLLATGTSLQQAADAHWVMQPEVTTLQNLSLCNLQFRCLEIQEFLAPTFRDSAAGDIMSQCYSEGI